MALRDRLTFYAYVAAARLAQALPERSVPALGRVAGRMGGLPQRRAREVAAANQRRVTGRDDPGAVDRVFEWYGRYWLEILRMPAELRRGRLGEHFTIEGFEHIERAAAAGKGIILATPHLGGWEWGAAWLASKGYHLLAVVEDLDNPEVLQWFARQRKAFGLEVVPLGPDVSARCVKALRDNQVVCLVSDRDLTGDGVEVEFFGERTTLPAGPATLALRTGAALIPSVVYFRDGLMHHTVVHAPLPTERAGRLRDDIVRITQDLARVFEEFVAAEPAQWHVLQPNWPSDRR